GIEFDDHIRAFIHHPDVVVFIDAYGVREGSGIVVRPPKLDELQFFVELEELCGRSATRAAAHTRPRINKAVAFRILGYPFGFADRMAGNDERQYFFRDL